MIDVKKVDKKKFEIKIETECKKLTSLSEVFKTVDFVQVLQPVTQSSLYKLVDECGLHSACPIPVAINKALEVEAGLALPKDVMIQFQKNSINKTS